MAYVNNMHENTTLETLKTALAPRITEAENGKFSTLNFDEIIQKAKDQKKS